MSNNGRVVVIIGGSSGLGRATAQALATGGAELVLAARNLPALEEAAAECRERGAADVLIRSLDSRDEQAVAALGRDALERFGRIDVWINCAAQISFGRFDETPPEAFRAIIETNVLGLANGARTAVEIFRMQGGGHLINVGSMLGRVTEPLVSAYAASKFAVEGLTNVIAQELRAEKNIHVSIALPWAIDTPIYQRGANFSGRKVRTILPVYGPARAAEAICSLIARPRPQVLIGPASYLAAIANRISRRASLSVAGWIAPKMQTAPAVQGDRWGALQDENSEHALIGGWRRYWRRRIGRMLGGSRG